MKSPRIHQVVTCYVNFRKVAGFKIVDDDVSWDSFTPKPDEFDEVNDKLLVCGKNMHAYLMFVC